MPEKYIPFVLFWACLSDPNIGTPRLENGSQTVDSELTSDKNSFPRWSWASTEGKVSHPWTCMLTDCHHPSKVTGSLVSHISLKKTCPMRESFELPGKVNSQNTVDISGPKIRCSKSGSTSIDINLPYALSLSVDIAPWPWETFRLKKRDNGSDFQLKSHCYQWKPRILLEGDDSLFGWLDISNMEMSELNRLKARLVLIRLFRDHRSYSTNRQRSCEAFLLAQQRGGDFQRIAIGFFNYPADPIVVGLPLRSRMSILVEETLGWDHTVVRPI
jgi:hypothetical protein